MSILQQLKNEGSLVGLWDFRSGTIQDWSGKGNHFTTFTGPPLFDREGLMFPGPGYSITGPDAINLRLTTGTIVSLTTGLVQGVNKSLFFKRAGTIEYGLYFSATGVTSGGSTASQLVYTVTPKSKCLATSFADGTKAKFYLDGSYIGEGATNNVFVPSTNIFRIGAYLDCGMKVVSTALVNRPLTASEHSAIFAELQNQVWPSRSSVRSFCDVKPKVPDDGLVAAWDLGQATSGVVPELTGSASNGIISNAVIEQTVVGPTLKFSAPHTSNLTCASDATVLETSNQSWAVEIIHRINEVTATARAVWSKQNDTGATGLGCGLFYGSLNANYTAYVYNGAGNRVVISSANGTALTGVWNHMVLVYDHALSKVTLYRNGEVLIVPTDCAGFSAAPTVNFTISKMSVSSVLQGIVGCVKRCGVYNRAFSAAEVKTLFTASGLLQVRESSDWGSPVSTAARGGTAAGYLEQTGWQFGSTVPRYSVATSTVQGKTVKTISCSTAGHLYQAGDSKAAPQQRAYGTWEFSFNKAPNSDIDYMFIASDKTLAGTAGNNGYILGLSANENIYLYKASGVTITIPFGTAGNYFAPSVWYTCRFTRDYAGAFKIWILGGVGSAKEFLNWTYVGGASEPSFTASNYQILDCDAGDLISLGSVDGDYAMTWSPFIS